MVGGEDQLKWSSKNRHKAIADDPVLNKVRLVVEKAARSTRTTTKYTGNWVEYLAHCVGVDVEDPFMQGKPRELQELLITKRDGICKVF